MKKLEKRKYTYINKRKINSNGGFKVPILFITYNRFETSRLVFESIRAQKPTKLYFASDGPKNDSDYEKIIRVRDLVSLIDWDCEIKTLFRNKNLGCRIGVSSAITWFFEKEDMGIILEDDCLPNTTFFPFCENLLTKYKEEKSIGLISGNNYFQVIPHLKEDYFFSNIPSIWGWATWKRAWDLYDDSFMIWPKWKNSKEWKVQNPYFFERLLNKVSFNKTFQKKIDTWDSIWHAYLIHNGLISIIPKVNLVSNIGFGSESTNTVNDSSPFSNLNTFELYKIIHPKQIKIHKRIDYWMSLYRSFIILPFPKFIKGIFLFYFKKSKKIEKFR